MKYSRKFAFRKLAPVRRWVEKHPDGPAKARVILAKELAELTGQPISRQHMIHWLKPADVMTEPQFGIGLRLVEIVQSKTRNGVGCK